MASDTPKALTVFQVTTLVKEYIEEGFPELLVEGEISNYVDHSSGHIYFTLKDDKSQLACTLWKWQRQALRFKPADGQKVIVGGSLKVYEKMGRYQLNVMSIRPSGLGDLQLAFEQLKKRLAEEGLFDQERKKTLPAYPETVGIVTSESAAALRDIVRVAWRRNPCVRLVLIPAQVQGDGAAEDIARAIREFNEWGEADLLIVGRGGGSLEDLWAFNEEVLARAIAESEIPIVSAVGHETDFTIADFVADLRAPTPSAAVEMAIPSRDDLILQIKGCSDSIATQLKHSVESAKERLKRLSGSYVFTRPQSMVENFSQRLDDVVKFMDAAWVRKLEKAKAALGQSSASLTLLNPLGVLGRGYSITRRNGTIVSDSSHFIAGEELETVLHKGKIISEVKKVINESADKL
ncbi:MAG: exodeoxyribonuclease VII large subunit [Fibrobacteres bacterium]|nr:exodeoxyribonuclease VII large subunit [Fibrobacterota bacterium]